jgi:hypothetical protein
VASRLTIYSPTPVGWGNAEQALKCPEKFRGGALNYVSGPCTIFSPYQVGHPFGPETQCNGHSQNSPIFTWPPTQSRRHALVVAGGALPTDRLGGVPQGGGWPTANWPDLGVSRIALPWRTPTRAGAGGQGPHVNWPDLSVSKNGPPRTGQIWVCRKRSACQAPRQLARLQQQATEAGRANWWVSEAPKPASPPPPAPKSFTVDWRAAPTARRGPREARSSTAPLQAPGAAGALDGEVLTNKSSQGRADAQRLVATRLLDRVHDPLGHFSRLQRIYPRAR